MENFANYESVFSWRYGSNEMRELFSEEKTRKLWRKCWAALAKAQKDEGLVSAEELKEIEKNAEKIDVEKARRIEKEIKHDLMAELKVFSEQCGKAGGKLHFGATSMDIEDNAEMLKIREAVAIVKEKAKGVLKAYGKIIRKYEKTEIMALTHLQPAEPTTLGYRFANYAQDLLIDLKNLEMLENEILKGKGFKGAVGTSASYEALLGEQAKGMERKAMENLGIDAFEVSTQTYPRKVDYLILSALASVAASLHKFAFDLRILQSPYLGELSEPFAEKQVGSSAMPFKRNPVKAERICSLARLVSALPQVAWNNTANSLLERTLDDSANRRIIIPEAFLAVEECLILAEKIIEGLQVDERKIRENYERFSPFAMSEALLMECVRKGASRQEMHEILRENSMKAWKNLQEGNGNNVSELCANDKRLRKYLGEREILAFFKGKRHIGNAVEKCGKMNSEIEKTAGHPKGKAGKTEGF